MFFAEQYCTANNFQGTGEISASPEVQRLCLAIALAADVTLVVSDSLPTMSAGFQEANAQLGVSFHFATALPV